MKTKQYEAAVKALEADGGEPGTFSAVVAAFDNVDKVGDRLKAQAFDRTLTAWQKSGNPIPVVFAHVWDDPWLHIGYADPADVKAVPGRGLVVSKATLDIEDNPVARQVHKLMKRGTITEFSFGYSVAPGGETKAADGAYDLTDVNLFEFGPCLKGINPETELLEVKAMVHERAESAPAFKSADVQLSGSFEEVQDEVAEALAAAYAAPNTYGYVELLATYADHVVYRVCSGGEDENYIAGYTFADGEATVDTESAVTAELTATAGPAETSETKAVTVTGAFRSRHPNIVKPLREPQANYGGSGPGGGVGVQAEKAEDAPEVKADTHEIPEISEDREDTTDILGKTNLFLAQEQLKNIEALVGLAEPGYFDAAHAAAEFKAQLDALEG